MKRQRKEILFLFYLVCFFISAYEITLKACDFMHVARGGPPLRSPNYIITTSEQNNNFLSMMKECFLKTYHIKFVLILPLKMRILKSEITKLKG